MSTEYSHFSNLAFDRLFARGPDGAETLLINSSGVFVGLTVTSTLSLSKVLLGDGTVLLPSASFISDTNTGIYRVSSDRLGIATGGSAALIVTESQVAVRAGSATTPGYSIIGDGNTGIYGIAADRLGIAAGGAFVFGIDGGGQITALDGTAGAPTFSYLNDVDSGLYRVGANQIGIAAGGVNIATATTAALLVAKNLTVTGSASASNLSGTNTGDNVNASTSTAGILSTGTQSVAGIKTFATQLIGKGTATNDSASAGYIGEYIESIVSTATNYTVSTGVYQNITSISLTAGDWDIYGQMDIGPNGATLAGNMLCAISANSGSTTTDHVTGDNVLSVNGTASTSNFGQTVSWRRTISGTTTYYLKVSLAYSAGTPRFRGKIYARRRR